MTSHSWSPALEPAALSFSLNLLTVAHIFQVEVGKGTPSFLTEAILTVPLMSVNWRKGSVRRINSSLFDKRNLVIQLPSSTLFTAAEVKKILENLRGKKGDEDWKI
jgi:hypothetical protein